MLTVILILLFFLLNRKIPRWPFFLLNSLSFSTVFLICFYLFFLPSSLLILASSPWKRSHVSLLFVSVLLTPREVYIFFRFVFGGCYLPIFFYLYFVSSFFYLPFCCCFLQNRTTARITMKTSKLFGHLKNHSLSFLSYTHLFPFVTTSLSFYNSVNHTRFPILFLSLSISICLLFSRILFLLSLYFIYLFIRYSFVSTITHCYGLFNKVSGPNED